MNTKEMIEWLRDILSFLRRDFLCVEDEEMVAVIIKILQSNTIKEER